MSVLKQAQRLVLQPVLQVLQPLVRYLTLFRIFSWLSAESQITEILLSESNDHP